MKQNLIRILSVITIVLFITGCRNKEALSTIAFKEYMEKKEYEIVDLSSEYNSYNHIKNVIIAKNNKDIQLEFSVFKDEETAKSIYKENQSNIKSNLSKIEEEKSIKLNNHSKYYILSSDYYIVISKVDNTIIYVKASISQKEYIDFLLEELGY